MLSLRFLRWRTFAPVLLATYSRGFILWSFIHLVKIEPNSSSRQNINVFVHFYSACLYGGVGPQIGEVTCGGSPRLSWTANDLGRLRIRLLLIKQHVNLLNKIYKTYNYISVPISAKRWNATWIGSYQLFQRKTKFVVSIFFFLSLL